MRALLTNGSGENVSVALAERLDFQLERRSRISLRDEIAARRGDVSRA